MKIFIRYVNDEVFAELNGEIIFFGNYEEVMNDVEDYIDENNIDCEVIEM